MYYNKNFNGYGTAFLIADNVVLTAAHNIYDRSEKIPIKFVNFIMEPH
jgi:V8-like Glu-specific endopeptidase